MRIHRFTLLVTLAVVLVCVCAGVAIHAVLHADETGAYQRDFNLYTLVPQSATVVVETDRMGDLIEDIDGMPCSRDGHYLYVSDLFVYLKQYYYTLVTDAPHGLSKQMNKMLLSFHEPDSPASQVLYFSLGEGDLELVQSFVQRYSTSANPPERSSYHGAKLYTYPTSDGRELTTYHGSNFLAVSLQRALIEQVVDAHRTGRSLMKLPGFESMHEVREQGAQAMVYVRMRAVDMGQEKRGRRHRLPPLGSWAAFNLMLAPEGIYCQGMSHEPDTASTFVSMLSRQEPLTGLAGDRLPRTAIFHNYIALTDCEALRSFAQQADTTTGWMDLLASDSLTYRTDNEAEASERRWLNFVADYAQGEMMTCLFLDPDGDDERPCAVMSMPVTDEREVRHRLNQRPTDEDGNAVRRYPCWRIYRGQLLMASNERSLAAYVRMLDRGEVLDKVPGYKESAVTLLPSYNFLMMADMEALTQLSVDNYAQTMPNFFFQHARFFRHFIIAMQLTRQEDTIRPYIVLLYKGDDSRAEAN